MQKPVRKAVFPVAGLGTRILPATKAMPKEMLTIVDKPLIQYAIEEARAAGIEEFYFVTGRGKSAIEDHFDLSFELDATLRGRGRTETLDELEAWLPAAGEFAFTRQQRPLGLGHAVWCARHLVGDEPFAVLLVDDLMIGEPPCLKQMIEAQAGTGGNMVAVIEVPREQTRRYGVLDVVSDNGMLVQAKGVVEKPDPAVAPSTLTIIGRYIIQPEVFGHLAGLKPGSGNEIQLTDGLDRLIAAGQPFHGIRVAATRYDCGDKLGYLEANVALGLQHPALADGFRQDPRKVPVILIMSHRFDPSILREYDIRGIVGQTLFAADARALGRVFAATVLASGGRRVAVAYDGRLTSPELEAALVDGLATGGVDIVRIGRGPTPMLYFAAATLDVAGGIMVTGSHNPPDHNGFKLVLGGKPFFGAAIQKVGEMALALGAPVSPRGRITEHSVFDDYVARIARDYDGAGGLTVAWDCGNGATGEVVSRLVQQLPGRHILINETIDGTFPAHHPDPTVPENLVQLQAAVAEHSCDLGIGFDGDGDRIGVIDARQRILWGDQLMIVLARDVLKRHPGGKIIADVKASQVLFDEVTRAGGKPVMAKTGHSLIKEKLAETGAPLAGEMSGHIFFADGYYGFDDAIYVAVRLLGILARSDKSLTQMVDKLPVAFNTPELRLECDDVRKFAVVDEVKARLRQSGAEMTEIDGVRVNTPDGWWLLRASNTQAVIVVRAELTSPDGLERLKARVTAEITPSGLALPRY